MKQTIAFNDQLAFDKGWATQKKSLIAFAAGLFGVTALCVALLKQAGIDPDKDFSPAIIVIAHAPSLVALAVTAIFFGRKGLIALLKQVTKWRVGLGWYGLVLLGPLGLV